MRKGKKDEPEITVRPTSDKMGICGHYPTLTDYDRWSDRGIANLLNVDPKVAGTRLTFPGRF